MAVRNLIFRQSSTAKTSTFSSPDVPFDYDTLSLLINVTAVSGGTPSMVITLEGKDEDGAYITLATLAAITAANKVAASFGADTANNTALPATLRITFTITGSTPSFTFTASAYGGRVGS